jgi:hypothetical protein
VPARECCGGSSRCCRPICIFDILSPSDGRSFATVVLSFAIVPTRTSRTGSVAASRMASATFSGSIMGVGSFGSWLM